MAIADVNLCGFESGGDLEAYLTSGTYSVQSTTVRTGGFALRVNPASGAAGYYALGAYSTAGQHQGIGNALMRYYTFYFRMAALPSGTTVIAEVAASALNLCASLSITSGGALTCIGSTTSATIATLSADVWYRIDWRVDPGTATCGCAVDGGTEQTCTSTGNSPAGEFRMGRSSTPAVAIDFFYDDACISSSEVAGEGEVNLLTPDGDGSAANWDSGTGTTWPEVDDYPHDGDTTYLATTGAGSNVVHLLSYESTASGGVGGTISAVKSMCIVRTDSVAGTSSVRLKIKNSATERNTSTVELTTSYAAISKVDVTDPNGGAAWTSGGLDTTEMGMEAFAQAQVQRMTQAGLHVWSAGSPPATGNRRRRVLIAGSAA